MIRVDRNLSKNLLRFKMLMEGSAVDPSYLEPILQDLGNHAHSAMPPALAPGYVNELHRAYLGKLLFCDDSEDYGCPISCVARALSLPYISGLDGISVAPFQWSDLYRIVDAQLRARPDGGDAIAGSVKPLAKFGAASSIFHDSRLDELVNEIRHKGILWTLGAHLNRSAHSQDHVQCALLRLVLATAMESADVDVVAVCAYVHVASVVQAKGASREVAENLVSQITEIARDVYRSACGLHRVTATTSELAHLLLANCANEPDSLLCSESMDPFL